MINHRIIALWAAINLVRRNKFLQLFVVVARSYAHRNIAKVIDSAIYNSLLIDTLDIEGGENRLSALRQTLCKRLCIVIAVRVGNHSKIDHIE